MRQEFIWGQNDSGFLEIVRIDSLDLKRPRRGYAYLEVDHELRKALPINQNQLRIDVFDIGDRFGRERAGRNEDSLFGSFTVKRADESLDFRTPDGAVPSLGLKIDDVETQPILADDPVDAFVS